MSPRLTHLAGRFWTEIVDWDDVDAIRVRDLDAVQRVTIPTFSWRSLLGYNFSAIIVALPGFEREVLGALITHLQRREMLALNSIGFISTFRDAALLASLEGLGFAPALAAAAPDAGESVLWAYERRTACIDESDRSAPTGKSF